MNESKLGYIPDPEGLEYKRARSLLGARLAPSRPENMVLLDHVRSVNDQAGGSCVANAVTKGVDVRLRYLGYSIPDPSPQALYILTRRRLNPAPDELLDDGSRAYDACAILATVGMNTREDVPDDYETLNQDLPFGLEEKAAKLVVADRYEISTDGEHRSDLLAQAIDHAYPIALATTVTTDFFDYRGGVYENYGAEDAGGHQMLVLAYRTNPVTRGREFGILNSWGTTWGERGMVWVAEPFIRSTRVNSCFVMVVSP